MIEMEVAQAVQTIHRGKHVHGFTVLPNTLLQDASLSFRARGLLVMMLSLPADWQTFQTWIEGQGKEGKEAVRTAVKELESAGYLQRFRIKERGRIIGCQWHWYDSPQAGNPAPGNLTTTKDSGHKETVHKERVHGCAVGPLSPENEVVWEAPTPPQRSVSPAPAPTQNEAPGVPVNMDWLAAELVQRVVPNLEEFERELRRSGCKELLAMQPHLYRELCRRNWQYLDARENRWLPIRDWVAYLREENQKSRERIRLAAASPPAAAPKPQPLPPGPPKERWIDMY